MKIIQNLFLSISDWKVLKALSDYVGALTRLVFLSTFIGFADRELSHLVYGKLILGNLWLVQFLQAGLFGGKVLTFALGLLIILTAIRAVWNGLRWVETFDTNEEVDLSAGYYFLFVFLSFLTVIFTLPVVVLCVRMSSPAAADILLKSAGEALGGIGSLFR